METPAFVDNSMWFQASWIGDLVPVVKIHLAEEPWVGPCVRLFRTTVGSSRRNSGPVWTQDGITGMNPLKNHLNRTHQHVPEDRCWPLDRTDTGLNPGEAKSETGASSSSLGLCSAGQQVTRLHREPGFSSNNQKIKPDQEEPIVMSHDSVRISLRQRQQNDSYHRSTYYLTRHNLLVYRSLAC